MQFNGFECGKRIQKLRKLRSKSQIWLAAKLNIRVESLSAIENGHRSPSIDLVMEAAKIFNVSLDYLIYGHESDLLQQIYRKNHRALLALQEVEHLLLAEEIGKKD